MINNSFLKLKNYIESQNFEGYDPYDTLNTPIPLSKWGKWPPIIAIQIQKRNPINIRSLVGIKKGINPKAMGLFLQGYSILHQQHQDKESRVKADYFFNWLIKNYTKGYNGHCWGYNFDWASPAKYLKAYSPTIVVSGFIAKGIYQYWLATKEKTAIEVLESIGKFMWEDLERTENDSGICLSYSTVQKDCCYNATMLGAEVFAMLYKITSKQEYKQRAISIANFVIEKQHVDGHWNYSIDPITAKERVQIDFHQGYVLDSLHYIEKYIGYNAAQVSIKKGLEYYKRKQFNENGQSIWRVPKKWPTDIHNQSQGIITFTRLREYDENGRDFAKKITKWTIQNMQGTNGAFYYKKYPTHTIKTPFIRWSQAWMFLALVEFISCVENDV